MRVCDALASKLRRRPCPSSGRPSVTGDRACTGRLPKQLFNVGPGALFLDRPLGRYYSSGRNAAVRLVRKAYAHTFS